MAVLFADSGAREAQLAASIWLGNADHTLWLDDLADLLGTTADRGSIFAEEYLSDERNDRTTAEGASAMAGMSTSLDPNPAAGQTASGTRRARVADADAVAAFTKALTDAADAEFEAAADVEALAVEAAGLARDAVTSAADRARHAAQAAKVARAAATTQMAELMATTVAQTALTLQLHADQEARTVASAALEAASLVALTVLPGTERANREKALTLAETIRTTAVAKAEETALAAAVVARAASMAAMEVAAIAADAAMALELEVADTAAAFLPWPQLPPVKWPLTGRQPRTSSPPLCDFPLRASGWAASPNEIDRQAVDRRDVTSHRLF